MRVLVLNSDFEPYDIISWQRAMCKLLGSQTIYPVKVYDRRIRDGKGNLYDIPAVVVLKQYASNSNKTATYSKTNIYSRDMNICQYCGTKVGPGNRTIDHVVPRAKYNPKKHKFKLSSFENVVTACIKCNSYKGDRTLQECNLQLLKQPKKITRAQAYKNKLMMGDLPEQWWEYINR